MEMDTLNSPSQEKIMSPGTWALNIFIASIPIVGFIVLIVWALDKTNHTRRNWAIGMLILMIIVLVLYIILFVVLGFGALFMNSMNQLPTSL